MVWPPHLQPGDTVVVVSPSRRVFPAELEAFAATIKNWGMHLELGEHVVAAWHQQAGTDGQRLHDLQWALDHPTAKAIFASRGGYGLTRFLDQLDFTHFLAHPKWLIGFSDFTPILNQVCNQGIASLHATVPRLFAENEQAVATLYAALRGWPLSHSWQPTECYNMAEGQTLNGTLVGGNLSMIADSIGTASQLEAGGHILFLEDVGEAHYRLDRQLVHLLRAGILGSATAVVLGQFSDLPDLATDFGATVPAMVHRLVPHLPVVAGLPAGHVADNRALIIGGHCSLTFRDGFLSLTFAVRPQA